MDNNLISISQKLDNAYITFSINNKKFALDIRNTIEIINLPEIEISEIAPDNIIGMFNYKGFFINVIDLCNILNLEHEKFDISNKLIIALVNGHCFAIHCQNVENVSLFENNQIQNIPYNSENSIIQKVYKTENESISIVNIETLNEIISKNTSKTSKTDYSLLTPDDEKSKQILHLRAENTKNILNNFAFSYNNMNFNQHILFTLNNNNYYLNLKYVKEFLSLKRQTITKLPYTKDFIKGLINIRGSFVVVIDLKKFLNQKNEKNNEANKIIIAEGKNFDIAFLVDEIKYIKNLKNITEQNNNIDSNFIQSEFVEENILYSIINFEKIINDERLYINIE